MSEFYRIDASDLRHIEKVMTRLYREDTLSGNEQRDLAHVLYAILDTTRQQRID